MWYKRYNGTNALYIPSFLTLPLYHFSNKNGTNQKKWYKKGDYVHFFYRESPFLYRESLFYSYFLKIPL